MALSNLTRRSFLKAAAATAVATTAASGLTFAGTALAETEEPATTDVKRIRSCCRGCGKMECGVWVTVENGRAVTV